ncbi:MAG: SLOG family protein [Sporolactobacillus sp.]
MARAVLISGYTATEFGIFTAEHPGIPAILHCLSERISSLAAEGVEWFVISGQQGTELWAAQAVFALREKAQLPLRLAFLPPFLDQDSHYRPWLQTLYAEIRDQADFYRPISNRPYESPLQLKQKDQFLVAHTEGLLLIYDEKREGSPRYLLSAAEKKAAGGHYSIMRIDGNDLETAAEDLRWQHLY